MDQICLKLRVHLPWYREWRPCSIRRRPAARAGCPSEAREQHTRSCRRTSHWAWTGRRLGACRHARNQSLPPWCCSEIKHVSDAVNSGRQWLCHDDSSHSTITTENNRNVFSPPAHRSVIVCANSFIVIPKVAPALHNGTSVVKSPAAHRIITILELSLPFDPRMIPRKFRQGQELIIIIIIIIILFV